MKTLGLNLTTSLIKLILSIDVDRFENMDTSPHRKIPSTQLRADSQEGRSILHRIGPVTDSRVQSDSEESSTSAESDEPDWTKRSKVPRMRMYADEEEVRIERRKAQVQAHTRRESRSVERETRHRQRRRRSRSNSVHREHSRSHRSRERRHWKSDKHESRDRETVSRSKDDLRSRLHREGRSKLKGSVCVIGSTVWDRLNDQQRYNAKDWEQETSESDSQGDPVADDNDRDYPDLRDSLKGVKNSPTFEGGDLRSKLNQKKTMRQNVPVQKSPLRIEIDNDEYYRLIGSDQE